mgnify:CR=1 FL=1
MVTRLIAFMLTFFSLNSCSYKTRTLTTIDDKKVRARFYKDPNKQEAYENKFLYKKYYTKMVFEKFNEKIFSDTTINFTYFQFDSIRIYIDKTPIDGNRGLEYSGIFKSGLLFPKIISCALNSTCLVPQDSTHKMAIRHDSIMYTEMYLAFDTTFLVRNYNWTGSKIYFSNIKELTYLEKKTTRVFELEHKIYHGDPTDAYYFIELTNDNANKNTLLNEFIKGCRLTFLKHTYTLMEL